MKRVVSFAVIALVCALSAGPQRLEAYSTPIIGGEAGGCVVVSLEVETIPGGGTQVTTIYHCTFAGGLLDFYRGCLQEFDASGRPMGPRFCIPVS